MLAKELGVSPTYLSDVENDRRHGMSNEKLQKIIEILELNESEQMKLYDLAGEAKNTIPADLEDFVKDETIIALLRRLKKDREDGTNKET